MDNVIKFIESTFVNMNSPVMYTIKSLGIIIIAIVVVKVGNFIIKKTFEKQKNFKYSINIKRLDTMSTLTRSIFKYLIYTIAVISILTDVFDIKSVLTAAGIGGLAIGFGAQSLIKDVISGFFIVFENQFEVGDIITIDNLNGTVEHIELRVTRIRNVNGDLYIIPNGEIKKIINHSKGNKTANIDIPISYEADLSKAVDIVNKICEEIVKEFDVIVEAPKILGVTEFHKDNLVLRVTTKTLPNEHYAVERRFRELVKDEFSKANIEFYYRQRPL
ncbi:mechanosensitive ion channel family protein [Pseudobacteroides cellulosolvens]|uniref:MscS Mechanosensitive ion channel n=1 Tax=Pseudobacteroides cellulosolvens ATCC 35603 = DSM 2933 TaxID=398512 RepID=A0A0L6JXA6_9FIRM|nr:mechanosensitive ion channel family protein [Pseudobacteroides cellulosolvens]KNY30374.1 MscS Mechanosensitive ion channel [Pseudobacteroides cellulosolvens ATCC 35603 = DSM 2933]